MKALAAAKAAEADEAAKREAEEKARAEERERRRAEAEAKEREEREREERAKAKAEKEERKQREAEEAKARAAAAKAAPPPAKKEEAAQPRGGAKPAPKGRERDSRGDDRRDNRGGRGGRDDGGRRSGKLTLNQALSGEGGRQKSLAAMKRKQERARQKAMGGTVEREKVIRDVQLPEAIMVSELANRCSYSALPGWRFVASFASLWALENCSTRMWRNSPSTSRSPKWRSRGASNGSTLCL